MREADRRLFVGVEISSKLQRELDNCARGAERYFKDGTPESLEIITMGELRLIGRFLQDGFPVNDIDNVSRNVRSIVGVITAGYRLGEDSIRIYAGSTVRESAPVS